MVRRTRRSNPHVYGCQCEDCLITHGSIKERSFEVMEKCLELMERLSAQMDKGSDSLSGNGPGPIHVDAEFTVPAPRPRTPGEGRKGGGGDISEFEHHLTALINRYSLENETNLPDFILADYLVRCLESLRRTVQWGHNWYDGSVWKNPMGPTGDVDVTRGKKRD